MMSESKVNEENEPFLLKYGEKLETPPTGGEGGSGKPKPPPDTRMTKIEVETTDDE